MNSISPVEVPDGDLSASRLYAVGRACDDYLAGRRSDQASTVRVIPHNRKSLAERNARIASRGS